MLLISKVARNIFVNTLAHSFSTTPTNIPIVSKPKVQKKDIYSEFTQFHDANKQQEISVGGRSWRTQQLRIKSTQQLHKLWYTCVREKNVMFADKILAQKEGKKKQYHKGRLEKIRKTMSRILTVYNQREKIKKDFRAQLENEYIAKKKAQIEAKLKQKPQELPPISSQLLRAKYFQLRKGVDNLQYLERIWQKKDLSNERRERMQIRLSQKKQFTSYFQVQQTIGEKPTQQEILRSHIKNWRSLNLKQRKIILGFLNARRAKDAKSAFLKELKILGQKIAYEQLDDRVKTQ